MLFDLDGTIYVGDQLIDGANDVINALALKNVDVAFLTNNSTKTREQIKKKLDDMGISSELKDIYTSVSVTARYLQQNGITRVYAVGTESLKLELRNFGIEVVEDASSNYVVIGMMNNIEDYDLSIVSRIAHHSESILIACNRDMSYPNGEGSTATGCGQVVNYIEDFLGRSIDVSVGKPEHPMLQAYSDDNDISPGRIMIVGDSYSSDIQLAINVGSIPVLISESPLHYRECITINSISQLLQLFDLPDVLYDIADIQDESKLHDDLVQPYQLTFNRMEKVYLFGAQKLGEKVYRQCVNAGIEVLGFIDNDINKQGSFLNGQPIFSLTQCSKEATIIITSTYVHAIQQQLEQHDFKNYIPFTVLNVFNKNTFASTPAFANMHNDLLENKLRYISLYLLLADKESKSVLCDLLQSRVKFEFHKLIASTGNPYFEDSILHLEENEIFIDGGAYSGDTALKFIQQLKAYQKIYIFEPDEQLINEAKFNLKEYGNIEFYQKGLYSHPAQLFFDKTGGMDGAISNQGEYKIDVTSIDVEIKGPSTYLKLDIEGAEEDALRGAAAHLAHHQPQLAIACYHKASDLWNLTKTILELYSGYRIYLRHYSNFALETILYAVPANTSNTT